MKEYKTKTGSKITIAVDGEKLKNACKFASDLGFTQTQVINMALDRMSKVINSQDDFKKWWLEG